jgi:hypothetical protein
VFRAATMEQKASADLQFAYSPSGENKGLLYWLGTDQGTAEWKNPCSMGAVKLDSSKLKHDSDPLAGLSCTACQIVVLSCFVRSVRRPLVSSRCPGRH